MQHVIWLQRQDQKYKMSTQASKLLTVTNLFIRYSLPTFQSSSFQFSSFWLIQSSLLPFWCIYLVWLLSSKSNTPLAWKQGWISVWNYILPHWHPIKFIILKALHIFSHTSACHNAINQKFSNPKMQLNKLPLEYMLSPLQSKERFSFFELPVQRNQATVSRTI